MMRFACRRPRTAAQRQRQQGRDAAQLARRARAVACSRRSSVCVAAGAPGITVHPRADARHITPADVRDDRARCSRRARRTSSSTSKAIRGRICSTLVHEVRPDQCTLVPVVPGEITSQAGWPPDTPTRASCAASSPACSSAASASACSSTPIRRAVRVGRRRSAPTASSSTPSRSRARSSAAADAGRELPRATSPPPTLAHDARPGRQRRPRSRPRQPGAVPDAAAPRRGVDRPRASSAARCSSASNVSCASTLRRVVSDHRLTLRPGPVAGGRNGRPPAQRATVRPLIAVAALTLALMAGPTAASHNVTFRTDDGATIAGTWTSHRRAPDPL